MDYDIYHTAAAIAAENKTPTVALLKARLPKSTPLAQVIKGLQYWQSNPTPPQKPTKLKVEACTIDKALAQYIDNQISLATAPLYKEIKALQQKIQQLRS